MKNIFLSSNLESLRRAKEPLGFRTTFFANESTPFTFLSIGVSEDILVGITKVNQNLSVSSSFTPSRWLTAEAYLMLYEILTRSS